MQFLNSFLQIAAKLAPEETWKIWIPRRVLHNSARLVGFLRKQHLEGKMKLLMVLICMIGVVSIAQAAEVSNFVLLTIAAYLSTQRNTSAIAVLSGRKKIDPVHEADGKTSASSFLVYRVRAVRMQ
jgi:hypothetical protein